MSHYCQDRDILAIEPVVFLGGFPGQKLIAGASGSFTGTTFTITAGSFAAAQVETGMVLCVHDGSPSEGRAYEIVTVESATQLTTSVLRADTEDTPVAPPEGATVSFHVQTYAAQIRAVSTALGEKLRQISELDPLVKADFADSEQLKLVTGYGALAEIFAARADNAERYDANWIKAQHYRQLYAQLLLQLRLAVDTDGDGLADRTRSLGNVALRRS